MSVISCGDAIQVTNRVFILTCLWHSFIARKKRDDRAMMPTTATRDFQNRSLKFSSFHFARKFQGQNFVTMKHISNNTNVKPFCMNNVPRKDRYTRWEEISLTLFDWRHWFINIVFDLYEPIKVANRIVKI